MPDLKSPEAPAAASNFLSRYVRIAAQIVRTRPRVLIGSGVVIVCLVVLLPPSSNAALWFFHAHGVWIGTLLIGTGLFISLAKRDDENP